MMMLIMAVLLLTTSCLKTEEVLINQFDICADKKELADPEDYRDPYDNCLMMQEEYVRSKEGCTKICKDYCMRQDQNYKEMWVDFSGCHCYCERKLE
jgi:hypothetical protein